MSQAQSELPDLPMALIHLNDDTPYAELCSLEENIVSELVACNNPEYFRKQCIKGILHIRKHLRRLFANESAQRRRVREAFNMERTIQRECEYCTALVDHTLVVCPECHRSSKTVADSELQVNLRVPKFRDRVNSRIILGEVHTRGNRILASHFRRQCVSDHRRALELGYDNILDSFTQDREFRRAMYHCHLDQADHVVAMKNRHGVAAMLERGQIPPVVQTMDHASRVQNFGSRLVIKGPGYTTNKQSNDRHAFYGRRLRAFLNPKVGTSELFPSLAPKALTNQPGIPTKGDLLPEVPAVVTASGKSTHHEQASSSTANYSREPPPHDQEQRNYMRWEDQEWWWGRPSSTPQHWQ